MTDTSVNHQTIPASPIQEHFWLLHQLNKEDTAYNIPSVFRIKGPINLEALTKAINTIVKRHDSLRSNFIYSGNELKVKVHQHLEPDFQVQVIEDPVASDVLPDEVISEIHHVFDLERDSLLRIRLFETGCREFFLTIVFHHSIIDLRSKDIFSKELSEYYHQYHQGGWVDEQLAPEYAEYIHYLGQCRNSDFFEKQCKDWALEIDGKDYTTDLPADVVDKGLDKKGKRKYFRIPEDLSCRIKDYCNNNASTSFNFLLSVWFMLLHRVSGQEVLSMGVPFTNRRKEDFQNTIGCFVNILPIIISFRDNPSFTLVSQNVRMSMLKAHRKQETPFLALNKFVEQGGRLFNIGFTFEHPMQLSFDDAQVTNMIFEREGAQLDLFATLWEDKETIQGTLEYADGLISADLADSIVQSFLRLIETVLQHPQLLVSEIDMIPAADLAFISAINQTAYAFDETICLHQKLEEQASHNPHSTALLFGDKTLNFDDLNRRSNDLAHYLIGKGVEVEDIVSICCYRSLEMMTAIFGILKAGAAYLPVNPNDPAERIGSIIRDAKPKYILTTKDTCRNVSSFSNLIFIDELLEQPLTGNFENPVSGVHSSNLAYIIYTSGSTGTPKGVMIEHRSVINRLAWMQRKYPVGNHDTLLQKTPVTFDVSVWELFWWTFTGSRLSILPPDAEKDPESIIRTIQEHAVTTIHFVPSMFKIFLATLSEKNLNSLISLRRIFLSGEALPVPMVNRFNQLKPYLPDTVMVNLYGPTEATVDISYYNCPQEEVDKIYIGRPIDNTGLYVINKHDRLQPLMIAGELVITGVNLSRGYLNRPELNRQKYFDLDIPGQGKVRAYKTGDLVRLCRNGELEYIDRIDNQIKIRGFRVELGEIESKLLDFPGVETCAVIADGTEEKRQLLAYVCRKKDQMVTAGDLKEYLRLKVPEYMIPAHIVFIDHLPLSSSGKINRKALPKPDLSSEKRSYEAATSQTEKRISSIWRNLLGVDQISITDNFFDLGGNSLLSIRLSAELSKEFQTTVSPMQVLEYTNIRDFSAYLSRKDTAVEVETKEIDKRMQSRRQNLSSGKDRRRTEN